MDYDPTATYKFTDADGNVVTSLGDNGYIWQAYTEGLPLSINENGEWFVTPYLDTSGGQIVSYIPEWFKSTPDYASWEALEGQLGTATPLQIAAAQDYLKAIGNMGAYKYAQTNYAKQFGITDQALADKYAQYAYDIALEGSGDQKANLNGLFGSDQNESVEDVLRSFKNMSKEELSETLTYLYKVIKKGSEGTWDGDQKTLADALTMVTLIDYTKDNLSKFGKDNEFDGLYDASFLQNFRRWFAVMSASFTENNVLGIPVRLLNWAVNGTPRIENRVNEVLGTDPTLGANLEGTTTSEKIGIWSGAAVNIIVTLYLTKGAGNFLNGKLGATSIGSFLSNSGNTITGAVAADFFVNDLPLDIVMFINDVARYEGDVGKALWNPEETQPLTGIPFFTIDEDNWIMPSGLGPQVPGGFVMNAIGDIMVDFAPKILQIATKATTSQIDGLTNGGVTRLRETAANKLIGVENKLAGNKLLTWWWKGFINKMMTPELANLVREARKGAVASKSNDVYIDMQNALTFNNQKGMSEVGPKFKKIENELKMPETIKEFINNAHDYGDVQKVKDLKLSAEGGERIENVKEVDDILPIQVKQGVLDVERLAELRGKAQETGGLISDAKTLEEISALEERLSSTPQKIKDFADTVALANKRVEDIRIEAGITQEEWINHLRGSPEFAKYMTRQTVNADRGGIGGASNPAEAKIFGKRKDYYSADRYIDPILALNLKVEAIGRAIAWNNTQRVLSVAEKLQPGNIKAGASSIDIAQKLDDIRTEVKSGAEFRQRSGYDDAIKGFNKDIKSISNSVREVNDLQNRSGDISVKSVYDSGKSAEVKQVLRDFSTGKIKFADGVKEAAGLTDSAAAQIINNTFRLESTPPAKQSSDSLSFEKAEAAVERATDQDIVGKGIGEASDRIEEVLNMRRDMNKLRNQDGEIDIGIYGITEKARERTTKALTAAADKIQKDIDAQRTALYEKFASSNKEGLDWNYNKNLWVDNEYVKRTLDGDSVTKESLAEEYVTKHPKPEEYTQEQLFKELDELEKGLENIYETDVTGLTWGLDSRALVDSDASMPFSDVFGKSDDYFQQLTRGEVRRSLYEGGYENSKFKSDIDKADNAFTQRAKEDFVGYRSETSGTDRTIKIGEPLDTSAWMYGAVTPGYTDTYRAGLTGGKKAGLSDGIMYRLHIKEGTPMYMPTAKEDLKLTPSNGAQYIKQKAHRYEFVLPRDIVAIPTAISKERVGLNPFKKMTVVDVEIDANSGYAPKLGMGTDDILGKGGNVAIQDNVPAADVPAQEVKGYNAGVTDEGVPYKYQMANGKIVAFEKMTDANEIADALSGLGGTYKIAPTVIDNLGETFTNGVFRAVLFANNDLVPLPTGATFRTGYDTSAYGWIPTPGKSVNQTKYKFALQDGHFVAAEYPLYMAGNLYTKGNESYLSTLQTRDVNSGFSPKNSNVPENTAVHENGHNIMARLTILELNRKIDDGILKVPENVTEQWMNDTIYKQWVDLHELVGTNALKSMGFKPSDAEIKRQASTISSYAGEGDYMTKTFLFEEVSESNVDYYCNKQNASPYTLAIIDQVRKISELHAKAADPGIVLAKNNLTAPKGMIKDDQYNFPASVKTDKQKSKWLDNYRKNNPYVGGKKAFDEDTYVKANLWDTFLQKEVRSYDPNSKSAAPDSLIKKNAVFLEKLNNEASDMILKKIDDAGISGLRQEIATMIMSRNSEDISNAVETFVIARVNAAAENVAKNLPGGATEANMNKARATLWADDVVRNEIVGMVKALNPELDTPTVQSSVNDLFKHQAEGFASYEALPVEIKDRIYEMKQLEGQLIKNNAYVKEQGKIADEKLHEQGWSKDTTQVVHYKQAGQDVYLLVKDPMIASLYNKPNNYKQTGMTTEGIVAFANFISRTYRMGTTSMNPIALVANVLRDPLQATIQGGFNPLDMNFSPEVFYKTLRGFGLDDLTIERVVEKGRNWTNESTMTAELRRYGTGVGYSNKVEKAAQAVNRVMSGEAKSKGGKALGKIIEIGEAPLEMWESYFRNQVYEQSFIKNYKKTQDVNKAMGAAMLDASNSTTNFSHAIGHYQNAISTVPYLSSAINGTRSFWVQFNLDPIGMVGRIVSGALVPTMAITAWNLSSEERRKAYLNLPEWYRQQHLVFIDLNNNVYALPIPGELEQYYGTARKLIEFTQEASPYALSTIMAHGAFGFLPVDVNGFFGSDGQINLKEGTWQLMSGVMPQAATAIYEWVYKRNLFTGQDISDYDDFNRWVNLLGNMFGTGIKEAINSIGLMVGTPEKKLVGLSYANTLARNLFGVGFKDATSQFMNLIGEARHEGSDGKIVEATGLFKENDELRVKLEKKTKDIAYAPEEEKEKLEEEKKQMVEDFTNRVKNLVNNYMNLYTITGGLEDWQKNKIVSILTLGGGYSSDSEDSYVSDEVQQASLSERNLAMQRYVNAGLPAGSNGFETSIEAQAALNRFYGAPKQASSDFTHIADEAELKDIRNEFYDAVDKIYDYAEEHNISPDYDMIEKVQARYLQAVDAVLIPVINEYGIDVLNNSKFIDTVEKYVNGMIPSDDWKQSTKNARKYLSTKEFPTATVNVKKWLIQRYSTGMRNRGLKSDNEVVRMLAEIKADIDTGKAGSAKGKIQTLVDGINRANYYISSDDFQLLTQFKNMVK